MSPDPAVGQPRLKRWPRIWLAVAIAVVVVGSASSVAAANSVSNRAADQSRRGFTASAAEIASTLQLGIQHEQDLIVSANGFIAENTNASNAQFVTWANSVQALQRYPELLGFGEAVIVPASGLAAFAAQAEADPTGSLGPDGHFQVVPPGARPFYCFSRNGQSRAAQPSIPADFDFCSSGVGAAGLAARDSGQGAYIPFPDGTSTILVVLSPVYQGGVTPTTVAARRSEFIGWVGMEALPQLLLQRALAGHADTAVTFTYHAGPSTASFQSGTIESGAHSITTNLNNGWTVQTYGVIDAGGIFHDSTALALLIAGLALTLAIAALIFVLATTRVRALRLVRHRTDQLRYQALHDSLTGLPNRALIIDRIGQLLARNRRDGTLGAILYVDLDGFKNVNDALGHGVGDRLLQAVAARLVTTLRDVDTIGRMSGDEFVVLIDSGSLESGPELVAERLLDVLRQPFTIDGVLTPMIITASLGLAIGHLQTPEELLREADMALYQAKAAGKNCYETFRPQMSTEIVHRYELEFELHSALERGEFRLMYQPIYDLNDLSMSGVEALVRWQHPSLGQITPDEFVPLLEASGQIVDVGRWVLHEACNQIAAWRGHTNLQLAVNVSGRQLDRDIIVDHVREALHSSGLHPSALTLEITETALMRNIDTTARRLRELKALGVNIAIDDFGTGYSSLAYLQRFPVDCLKIDRSFTATIGQSPESNALLHTLVQLGKDLGLTTLAEGVETTTQIEHLRSEGVEYIQGFLLARPLEVQSLETQFIRPASPPRPVRIASLPSI